MTYDVELMRDVKLCGEEFSRITPGRKPRPF